jgi:hypothetical protein
MPKTFPLSVGAMRLLHSALSQAGWTDSVGDTFRAGVLVDRLEQILPSRVVSDAALREVVQLDLNDRQVETARRCLEALVKAGKIPPSSFAVNLLRELGLAPEDG